MGGSGPAAGISLEIIAIVGLIVVIVALAAIAFSFYSTTQSQEQVLKAKQADIDSVSSNLSQMTADYASLTADYNRKSDDLTALKADNDALKLDYAAARAGYDNASAQYNALLNRSSLVDSRLNTFLENDPTIAYTYTYVPKTLPDGAHDNVLTVTAYNLGKTDIANVKVICTVNESQVISAYNKSFTYVHSLDKRQATWEFDGNATVVSVWAGPA